MPFADPGAKRAYDAARYVANREVVKARVAAYRLANSDEILRRQDEFVILKIGAQTITVVGRDLATAIANAMNTGGW